MSEYQRNDLKLWLRKVIAGNEITGNVQLEAARTIAILELAESVEAIGKAIEKKRFA